MIADHLSHIPYHEVTVDLSVYEKPYRPNKLPGIASRHRSSRVRRWQCKPASSRLGGFSETYSQYHRSLRTVPDQAAIVRRTQVKYALGGDLRSLSSSLVAAQGSTSKVLSQQGVQQGRDGNGGDEDALQRLRHMAVAGSKGHRREHLPYIVWGEPVLVRCFVVVDQSFTK